MGIGMLINEEEAIISPDDDVVAGMLSFGTCGKRTKNVTAADISLPFDFRIETHIDEDTSVGEMANAIKNSSQSLRARPNILRPDPNWPTVGQRQWRDRRPLTEQELRNSVFGEQVTTKKDVDGEEYDVILSRENTRVARPPVVDSAPATMPRRATPKPLPPNPPPR
ncbi:unnamed protein product, partial [Nippostrongylus brasiliensis]|uniref:Peptidase S1 domain-containing protein n=1 Tax=Nippostrongylus brasiliensis TaxID=27835 RepID=A0A0N4YCK5_NIPBR